MTDRATEKIDPAEPGFRYTRKVFFYETDLAGVVHFSCYFRYMEEAEHALQVDPGLFVDRILTFDEEANGALSEERVLASIGSLLGAAALVLLVIGLYGTMAAAVIRSRREIGIRLALGARPRSLRALVVARGLLVAGVGLGLGLPLAYAATKSFAHLLYGVQPLDPLVGAVTVAIVLATAAVASFVPARRAARVDPVIALRAE